MKTTAVLLENDKPTPIPLRFRAMCEFCNNELDIRAEGIHQWTAGWVRQREGGGGHGISLPQRANRWAHPWCIDRTVKGYLNQNELFADRPSGK